LEKQTRPKPEMYVNSVIKPAIQDRFHITFRTRDKAQKRRQWNNIQPGKLSAMSHRPWESVTLSYLGNTIYGHLNIRTICNYKVSPNYVPVSCRPTLEGMSFSFQWHRRQNLDKKLGS